MLRHWIAGTALAVTAGVAAEALGGRAFARRVREGVRALDSGASRNTVRLVGEETLSFLSRCSGTCDSPVWSASHRVHLRQRGRMQLGRRHPWIPLRAEQWHTVQPPGFVCVADGKW